MEPGGEGQGAASAAEQGDDSGSSSALVWTATGAVAVLAVAGGAVYIKRRGSGA
ncbi:hypothetical protein [Streptomyces sp. NPDC095613]|uniref:hypothetical protein n=1 Tax=Streptomyces sp. NPDC095613 TaxID=3155540 RepID=UPI0033347AE0